MGWFSNLFKKSDSNPTIQPDKPWPRNSPARNISEPVYAMVNVWKQDPKRFTFNFNFKQEEIWSAGFYKSPHTNVTITDTKSHEEFVFGIWLKSESWKDMSTIIRHWLSSFGNHRLYPILGCTVRYKPSWMTEDEMHFILESIKPYYLKRVNRYRELVEYRQDRSRKQSEIKSELAKKKERERLCGVYK